MADGELDMATAEQLFDLTNRVKLAAVALVQANERKATADQAYTAARETASEAGAALATAERALIRAAREVA